MKQRGKEWRMMTGCLRREAENKRNIRRVSSRCSSILDCSLPYMNDGRIYPWVFDTVWKKMLSWKRLLKWDESVKREYTLRTKRDDHDGHSTASLTKPTPDFATGLPFATSITKAMSSLKNVKKMTLQSWLLCQKLLTFLMFKTFVV